MKASGESSNIHGRSIACVNQNRKFTMFVVRVCSKQISNLKRQNAQFLFVSLRCNLLFGLNFGLLKDVNISFFLAFLRNHDSISSSSECISAQVLSNIFSKIVYVFNIYRYSQLEIMHLYLECQVRAKLQLLFML